MALAIAEAANDAAPGLLVWSPDLDRLSAALVLAPECPLEEAMAMTFAAAIGLADALGALAPPEVAVHFDWPGGVRVNGARCGRIRAAAATGDPAAVPYWLVVGAEIALRPPEGWESGRNLDRTFLHEEGCGEVEASPLLESWSRHTLVWINRWLDDGMAPLHAEWRAKAHGIGSERDGARFIGLDELGGMILRAGDTTEIRPLSSMLGTAT
jgi:biotin-(acetyl-CoA carboxylase) ligase